LRCPHGGFDDGPRVDSKSRPDRSRGYPLYRSRFGTCLSASRSTLAKPKRSCRRAKNTSGSPDPMIRGVENAAERCLVDIPPEGRTRRAAVIPSQNGLVVALKNTHDFMIP